jgi:hypothetical protein
MRLPKANVKIEDRTALPPREKYFDYWLSRQPSSKSGLTQVEIDSQDAGWTDRDLYFLRAVQADGESFPNRNATYFSGTEQKRRQKTIQDTFLRELFKR